MCSALAHVRFTPNADIVRTRPVVTGEYGHPGPDVNVRFGPEADLALAAGERPAVAAN